MTTIAIEKNAVIVIDPDKEEAEKVRKMLCRSMKNIAAINTRCLITRRKEIEELMNDGNYQKVFYGCSENFFNRIVESFNSKKGEVKYHGWQLDIPKIGIYYWKKHDFGVFPPTISKREESFGQEL